LTLMIGSWTVTPSSGCVTLHFSGRVLVLLNRYGDGLGVGNVLYLRPMGLIKRSYFTGRRVKSGPTNVGFVIILFQPFCAVFLPAKITLAKGLLYSRAIAFKA
jgi:hypothetical protein